MKKLIATVLLMADCFLFAQLPFTKNFIMAYHSCIIASCNNPANHTVRLAESNDGINWSAVPGFTAYSGSVPDPITRGNKLYIYTPASGMSRERVMRYDKISNNWDATTTTISVKDAGNNDVFFVDPSAYVDDNGLINLFFLNTNGITGDPAQCSSPPCIRYFDSAIEVSGSDGTQFVLQNNHRITFTVTGNFGPSDPDIFYDGTNYYLYISQGTSTYVYTSLSLHGNYTAVTTLPMGNQLTNVVGVPSGYYNSLNTTYMSYGTANNAGGIEIKAAFHNDFNSSPTYTTIITGVSAGYGSSVSVASPGICENTFLSIGIKEIRSDFYKTYIGPNPVENLLEVRVLHQKMLRIKVTDISGNILLDKICDNTTQEQIDMKVFAKGMYFISITNDKTSELRKIIKQ